MATECSCSNKQCMNKRLKELEEKVSKLDKLWRLLDERTVSLVRLA